MSLTTAGDGETRDVDPAEMIAGQALRLVLEVRSVTGAPLPSVETAFSVRAAGFADLLRFPEGDRCLSDQQGLCSVILMSRAKAGSFTLTASIAAEEPVVETYQFAISAERSSVRVELEIEDMDDLSWNQGENDPLARQDMLVRIDADQPAGRRLRVSLFDGFNNPLVGESIILRFIEEAAPVPPDAGPTDTGAARDMGSPDIAARDSGALDSGDVGAQGIDVARADAPSGDSGAQDTGLNKPLSLLAPGSPVQVIAASGPCLARPPNALLSLGARVMTDEGGTASFCIQPGGLRGNWRLQLDPAGFFVGSDGSDTMTLRGLTRAGAPTQIILIDPAEPAEGEAAPRIGCRAGSFSAVARFRVINANGTGVPEVRVLFDPEGGLDGLSTRLRVSDSNGDVTVQAICPARLLSGGKIIARLAEHEVDAKELAVEVRSGTVARIEIVPHGTWPDTLRSGAEFGLRLRAFDADDLPVLRAGLPPENDVPDTREALIFQFSLASRGHAEALRIVGEPGFLVSEQLPVDLQLGAADLRLALSSRATYSQPILLRAQAIGSQVSAQFALHVAPGDAQRLVVSPAGVVEALLGGAAGELVFMALDGEGQAANGVPGVPIRISAPASLLLAANWVNRQTLEGRTGPDGRFRVTVLQANELGDALVRGTLQTPGGPVVAGTTVRVGEGAAASLTLTLDGQALPQEEGLPSLTMRAATTLTQTLALRILNGQGAGLAGRGLSIDLESGDAQNCASFGAPGVSDQAGSISYGPGLLTLTAGGNIGTCIYRLAHGMTPASTRLRIVQVPGPPLTAVLTAELMEGAVRSLDNYSQSPNEWTDATSVAVTLQALDANNLAPEGLRMWLDISNCHVSQRAFELDADGRASFRVAGGGDEQADCSLRPRYFNELEQYETRAVNGRARRAGESIEEAAARSELLIETGGFAAPELISVGFGPSHSFVMESPGTAHTWQINADRDRLIYPNLLGNGDCTPAVACTQAELVAMQRNDDGVLEVRLDGNGTAQVLRDAIPLNYEFRDQGDPRIQVTLREGLMGAGRWLGLRLKHPGENGAVSNAQTFYAQPPTQWTGAGPGGAGGAVTITRPGGEVGAVTITGGWRRNLHGDATPELLLCGTDASGGWFAVVHLDENGALPSETQQAERSWSGGTYSAPYDARFACAVADLDNDGRDDLVVLAAPHNGFPSLVIHRGTDDAQVFSATGERLVWGGQDLRNTILGSLELEVGPAAVVVCLDGSLRTDRVCQTRKRLLLNLPENGAEAAGFEDLAMALITHPNSVLLGERRFVNGNGALSGQARWTGHTNRVACVAFSPDGQTIASGGSDRMIKLWNASTGALIRTLTGDTHAVGGVAFSPDGQTIASGGSDRMIKLWNASTGALIRTLTGHSERVNSVAFSPDGQTISSGSNDETIKLWNASTGALIRTLTGHTEGVRSVAFSPDGQTIASGSFDYSIKLWNASTGVLIRMLTGHTSYVLSVAFSPDGQTLASGSSDQTFKLWNPSDGVLIHSLTHGRVSHFYGAAFSPDGQTVVSGGSDGSIKLWNVSTGAPVSTLTGHTSAVLAIAVSPDGQTLVSGSSDHRIGLWSGGEIGISGAGLILNPGIGKPLPGQSGQGNTYLAAYAGNEIHLKRPYTWRPLCGDSAIDAGEMFDDYQPWFGGEYTTQCGATCGDSVVQAGEGCDDGNDSNADQCLTACRAHRCGDGLVRQDLQPADEDYESCDDGNQQWNDGCAPDCNRCGDVIIGEFESCDDGNDVADDGCSNCALDSCGDGQLDPGEDCDDGNLNIGDGCSSRCKNEVLCQRMGWKYGRDNWSCPQGFRMPNRNEWHLVARCIAAGDNGIFSYYRDVGISVGGCNCKWNGNWCLQPSIETIRGGRMCGDYNNLHICVR